MKRVLNLEVHTQMDASARRPSSLTTLPLASISELRELVRCRLAELWAL